MKLPWWHQVVPRRPPPKNEGQEELDLVSNFGFWRLTLQAYGFLLMVRSADLGRHTLTVLVQKLKTPKQELSFHLALDDFFFYLF